MFKRAVLGAALFSALTGASQAAIVSLAFSGNLSNSEAFSGVVRWDTSTPATLDQASRKQYDVLSFGLSIEGVDYSSQLSSAIATIRKYDGLSIFEDAFEIGASVVNGTGKLAGFTDVTLDIRGDGTTRRFYSSLFALPTNLDFLNEVASESFSIEGSNEFLVTRSMTLGAPVVAPPTQGTVPEPASLLLVALAGLSLSATRRRPAAT